MEWGKIAIKCCVSGPSLTNNRCLESRDSDSVGLEIVVFVEKTRKE